MEAVLEGKLAWLTRDKIDADLRPKAWNVHGIFIFFLFKISFCHSRRLLSSHPMACSLNGSIIHDLHNDFLNGTHPAVTQTLYFLRHLVPSLKWNLSLLLSLVRWYFSCNFNIKARPPLVSVDVLHSLWAITYPGFFLVKIRLMTKSCSYGHTCSECLIAFKRIYVRV